MLVDHRGYPITDTHQNIRLLLFSPIFFYILLYFRPRQCWWSVLVSLGEKNIFRVIDVFRLNNLESHLVTHVFRELKFNIKCRPPQVIYKIKNRKSQFGKSYELYDSKEIENETMSYSGYIMRG